MAALNYFNLVWDDVETFDGLTVSGNVKIRPYLSDVVGANDDDHTTLSPKPVSATLVNGVLKDASNNSYVRLVCDQASLTLADPLMYQVSFSRMKDSNGKSAPGFRQFVFAAPTATVDFSLAEAIPIPGAMPGAGVNFVEWTEVTEKPTYLAAGSTVAAARAAIGAAVAPKTRLTVPGYFEFGDKAAMPHYPAICLVGDSFVGNSYNRTDWNGTALSRSVAWKGDGFFNEAMVWNDQPATWWSMGVGGRTSAQALAGFDTEVAPYTPQIVLIHAGTNDIAAGRTNTSIFADLCSLVQKAWDLGARVILCNTIGRSGFTTAQNKQAMALNVMLSQLVMANPSGLGLLDIYSVFCDPSTGYPWSDMTEDGLHPNTKGAWVIGKELEGILDQWIQNPSNILGQGNANDDTNLALNTRFTGTSGYQFANNGFTGSLADSWFATSGGTDATMAVQLAKVADGSNFWQQVKITTTPASTTPVTLFTEVTSGFAAGDVVQLGVEFETDEAGWANGKLDLQALLYNVGQTEYSMQAFANKPPDAEAVIKTRPERGTLLTPPFTVPTTATTINMQLIVSNLGTVRFRRPTVRKLTKVAY